MTIQGALLGCLALLGLALFLSRKATFQLPRIEWLWFHGSVTWPIAVKAALGSFIFAADADSGTSYTLVTYGPALLMALVMLVSRLRKDAKPFAPGVWIFAGVAFSIPFTLFAGSGFTGVLPAVLLLPALLRRAAPIPLEAWFASARWSVFCVLLAVTATSFAAPENVIGLCRLDKCSIFGEVLTSPITNNGNFVGVAIAILLPLALLGLRATPLVLTAIVGLVVIEASGSRSAALSAWVVVVVVLLAAGNWDRRKWVSSLALACVLVASVVTAVGSFPREFATFRGGLWARAQELFQASPALGYGPTFWSNQPLELSLTANYSPHNIWLEFAVAGGVFGILCLTIAGITLLRKVAKEERYAIIMMLISLLALGIVEAPVQPGKFGLAPFAHLLPLIIGSACIVVGNISRRQEFAPISIKDVALRT
ncbi:O-antigen ligase family protein [Paenarthrobacter histidinolovorans]|uniref:O-antigen ligase family protein n=1 Tax=Paenarthrobacter histidinolovorans TaxID=43664 RepID=UPI001668AAE1|nr:O-antigen ligase family protein [Paenarthrobacter histidinolovorans]GGJ12410.1 hypothetical protein GCM10010052_07300 [Paenarthrobacter histidinolovorans]